MDKLAVVTITRNNYDELLDTISSLKTLPTHHLVVINGGECDRSRQFLLEQKIDHVSEPDGGIADAFNKGIRLALKDETNCIVFINSGDTVTDPTYAEKALHFLEKNRETDFTYGDIIFRDSLVGNIYMPAKKVLNLGRGMPCGHQSMIYRKSVFKTVGFFNDSCKIAMDYEHLCRMIKSGLNGRHIMAPPFVTMDGMGVSSTCESAAIKECYMALLKNGLMTGENRRDFLIRVSLFVIRKILIAMKMNKVLGKFKKIKYSRLIPVSASPGDFVIVTNSYQGDISLVERNLRHSLSQKPPPWKVIFIDQNEKKLKLSPEISDHLLLDHVHVRQRSVSAARNLLNVSSDIEWIIFCDDDGYLMEGYTEKFVEMVRYRPEVEILAGSVVRDDNGEFYTPRHKTGVNLNKFLYTKLLMGTNFACKAKTFKTLGGFDENFGVGAFWASGEETDFAWKAHFSRVPMLYCPELKVFHTKSYSLDFSDNIKKAFFYGRGNGALVAKWMLKERKIKPICEMVEMTLVPWGQVFKAVGNRSLERIALCLVTLLSRCWGFALFLIKYCFSREGRKYV